MVARSPARIVLRRTSPAAWESRAFSDGLVSVVLPLYLLQIGFTAFQVGAIITSTLLGSALLTLAVAFLAHRVSDRAILLGACVLMSATGAAFAMAQSFWLLLVIAFVGTLNPSAGDVSIFLPTEQALLSATVPARRRTALFARYSLIGAVAGAVGTLSAALPAIASRSKGIDLAEAMRAVFWLYAAIGVITWIVYRPLSISVDLPATPPRGLTQSRQIVLVLAALFSLDAFGGGFFVQSLLALWLYKAFHLSVVTASSILFWAGLCAAASYLVAVPLSERFGLINTMVFTHLPSNILLLLVPFAPNLPIAVGLLLARNALSQMDVPTRTSYVMAVVRPEERAAAAGFTAVPRSLASAVSPVIAGYLLTISVFGWPLIVGGLLKGLYDVLLLLRFRKVAPDSEAV